MVRRILVISAEDSSSIYALNVIRELGNINKNFRFFGTGAEFLRISVLSDLKSRVRYLRF